ncbi:AAA family ATPase [Candidatus Woesearchaeota archaeon]|nr:AAA family ATPase [Candidatus Woesearchaeota archaeon]
MKPRFVTLIVTGTPGTGKTTLAKKLSLLLDYTYFDVNSFVKKAHLYGSYDAKRHSYVVDEAKLARKLVKVREKALKASKTAQNGIIFDSHLSHFLPGKYADLCLVTRCSLKTLQHRLQEKGYGRAKIRENLDAEIFDTCLAEAQENGHRVVTFNTTTAKTADVKAFAAKIKKLLM